jgi:hypothetical protein
MNQVDPNRPRCFRWPTNKHPNGSGTVWRHGCYFPLTNLMVTDMGDRGTGVPTREGLEWLDEVPTGSRVSLDSALRIPPSMEEQLGRPDGL